MLSFPTVIDKRLKDAAPSGKSLAEAWGLVLLGVGVFLALACYSYSPADYADGSVAARVGNAAGRFGAHAAAHVLGRFGVVGMVWPVALLVWGALTATGFVLVPRPRRFLGFAVIAADLAGLAELLLPKTGLPEPSFGFGGVIGHMLRVSLKPQLGFSGALIALVCIGLVLLTLTGNLKLSKTADYARGLVYLVRRVWHKYALRLLRYAGFIIWNKWVLNKEPEELAALAVARGLVAAPQPTRAPQADGAAPRRARSVVEAPAAAPAAPMAMPETSLDFAYDGAPHGRPEASLFSRSKKAPDRSREFKEIAENLTVQLGEFKIAGEVKAVTQGPVVTTFEFKPAPGTKVSKIAALGEDLARLLKAQSLRVLAPIPGKDTVGFEVPNAERAMIGFADLLEAPDFKANKKRLPIAMGVDIFGTPVIEDLADMPHLLVAGSTGSGKSVFMNTLIGSLIARHTARELRFIMIDPKMVEMAAYNTLPHMARPVITDPQTDGKAALEDLVREMDNRYQRMRAVGARNIDGFNEIVRTRKKTEFITFEGRWAPMPYVVLIIDEMADMMMLLGKDAETPITRLAQKARAAGIHMVIATQRPSAEVVTGLIKANFPTRVAFRVMSGIDSRTILDQNGAETLLGKGDMLYLASGGAHRLHGAFLTEGEVQSMVKAASKKK